MRGEGEASCRLLRSQHAGVEPRQMDAQKPYGRGYADSCSFLQCRHPARQFRLGRFLAVLWRSSRYTREQRDDKQQDDLLPGMTGSSFSARTPPRGLPETALLREVLTCNIFSKSCTRDPIQSPRRSHTIRGAAENRLRLIMSDIVVLIHVLTVLLSDSVQRGIPGLVNKRQPCCRQVP